MLKKLNWDALGVTASLACAIHCAFLPILLTFLPAFGFLQNELFEYGMIALAFLVGVYALGHGFRHHHRRILPIVLFVIGMIFLLAKQFWHQLHLILLVPAVLSIVIAHYLNYRFGRVMEMQAAPTAD